jgi:hypothetical protein
MLPFSHLVDMLLDRLGSAPAGTAALHWPPTRGSVRDMRLCELFHRLRSGPMLTRSSGSENIPKATRTQQAQTLCSPHLRCSAPETAAALSYFLASAALSISAISEKPFVVATERAETS